jgi:uncharacterized SAM-binding protein YcdF (DUF218 family)
VKQYARYIVLAAMIGVVVIALILSRVMNQEFASVLIIMGLFGVGVSLILWLVGLFQRWNRKRSL